MVPKSAPKSTEIDEKFGRQIMQNIRLKESNFVPIQQKFSGSTGLTKRIKLNKQTEGTVSWNELPLIFSEDYRNLKIDKTKMEEIRKYFSLPVDKQIIKIKK